MRQVVKDNLIDSSDSVASVEMKSLGHQHKMNASMIEEVTSSVRTLVVVVSLFRVKSKLDLEKLAKYKMNISITLIDSCSLGRFF